MSSIKNFVSEWAGLIVNLTTLGGWLVFRPRPHVKVHGDNLW